MESRAFLTTGALWFSGGTTGTSLGSLQPPGWTRPVIGGCYGLSRTETADPEFRSWRQGRHSGQGALAPRDSARAERDRGACAASEAQRSRPEAPLGDAAAGVSSCEAPRCEAERKA